MTHTFRSVSPNVAPPDLSHYLPCLTRLHTSVAAVVPEITAEDRRVAEEAAELHAPNRSPAAQVGSSTNGRARSRSSNTLLAKEARLDSALAASGDTIGNVDGAQRETASDSAEEPSSAPRYRCASCCQEIPMFSCP